MMYLSEGGGRGKKEEKEEAEDVIHDFIAVQMLFS